MSEQPTILPWRREAAKGIVENHYAPSADSELTDKDVPWLAAIIARHDHGKRYAESLQQIAEEMGAPFESGPKIVQRVKALKAQHAETLRLLERAMDYFAVECYGSDLYKEIRAHLATQSHLSAKEKGTQ